MLELDFLGDIDKAVAKARYGAYALLDVNEALGERLDEKLREASKMIEARRKAVVRRVGKGRQEDKQASV